MKTQIPIYRASSMIDRNIVIGNLNQVNGKLYINSTVGDLDDTDYGWGFEEINPSTLSISFPDMLDSEGNKIFASLSEDGKGGDICEDIKNNDNSSVVLFQDYKITFKDELSEDRDFFDLLVRSRLKAIGIQE